MDSCTGGASRTSTISAGIRLAGLKLEKRATFAVGQRVRVQSSVVFKHLPKRKEGFDALGCEGVVVLAYDGRKISADRCAANISPLISAQQTYTPYDHSHGLFLHATARPIKVEFTEPCRWTAHFVPNELIAIGE
jgi:hypothetical protein